MSDMYRLAAATAQRREPRGDGRLAGVRSSVTSLLRIGGAASSSAEPGAPRSPGRGRLGLIAAVAVASVATLPMSGPSGDPSAGAFGLGATGARLAAGMQSTALRQAAWIAGGVSFGALVYVGADGERITPERIRAFLARNDSPMTRYASNIVAAGMRYGVDPRVVVAIAGVESTYGIYDYGHNAWGWGRTRWPSWPASIDGYTRALSQRYRSLRTGRFAAASRTYCPPCGDKWGIKALRIFRSI